MLTKAMSSAMAKTVTNGSSTAPVVRPKRVEVRWLESESELYLKQWQHRYHQLVGLDTNRLKKNGRQLGDDPFGDDWCLSSKSLLDLDIDFDLNYPKNNIIIGNTAAAEDSPLQPSSKQTIPAFDHIFWSTDDHSINQKPPPKPKRNKRLKPAFDDNNSLSLSRSSSAVDDEDVGLNAGRQPKDTTEEEGEESAEDSFENIRIQPIKRCLSKGKAFGNETNKNETVLNEKERQFSIDLNKRLELLAKDQALNDKTSDPKKAQPKPSRPRDRTRPARPRPPPIRRQIFKCEHIGCSYQSDRNFNFLRHKRTHRKNKEDDHPVATVQQPTATVLADISAVKSTQTLVIINNNQISNQNTSQTLKLIPTNGPFGSSSAATVGQTSLTSNGSEATHISIASVVSAEELQAIKTSIDCLLKSCDTTPSSEDNLKISINNSNGMIAGSACDEHSLSYHQKVVFV